MTRLPKICLAATLLATTSTAFAQQKEALSQRMTAVWQRALAAKASGDVARYRRLCGQYDALSAQLGGDQPGRTTPAAVPPANGPQFAVAPANCFGTPGTTHAAVSGTTGPIPDLSTATFTAGVSGISAPIWDVDLNVAITHTYNADLDITLISPAGTRCDVSSDNGSFYNDVFNGTLFDDQSLNNVTSYPYVDFVAAPDLRPEVSLNDTFRGELANGTWTLELVDDAGADVGNVNAWSLTITDGTIFPPPGPPTSFDPPVTFTHSPNMPIADYTTQSDAITVSGVGTQLYEVKVYTEITHTWNGDLQITLDSPAGTSVMLSDRWGGAADDVFNGTLFHMGSLNPIATYAFTSGVAAPDLQPDGNLANYWPCENPNGVWHLVIADMAGGDVGNLARWDLTVITAHSGCVSSVTNYCTSSSTTNSCAPVMSASATTASIAGGPGSFVVSANQVEGQQSGLIFYGIAGRAAVSWGTGSSSFLCVKAPLVRAPVANSGGTFGQCNGTLALDFFAFMAANPSAPGNPLTVGQVFDAQAWFRDPPAPKTTNLSNGIEWGLCP